MGLFRRLLIIIGVIFLALLLFYGYLGFLPGVSDIMGSNKPRDLGVKYTAADLTSINNKLAITYKTLSPTAEGAASLLETGSKHVELKVTQEELTALINDHAVKWKYYPIDTVQVKINQDGVVEMSGVLKIDRWRGYADSIKLTENIRSEVRPYVALAIGNPAVYLKGTLSISGFTQMNIREVQIGNFPYLSSLVQGNEGLVESFTDYAAKFYNLKITSATFSGGQLSAIAEIPQEISLAPPINKSTLFWAPSAAAAISSIVLSSAAMVASNSKWVQNIKSIVPDAVKKWFEDWYSTKSEMEIENKPGHILKLTKKETISYIVALTVLTLAFAYSGASALDEILPSIPIILATSIIVEFAKNYFLSVIARRGGIWTEHRIWFSGIVTFIASTVLFKAPFSSPSRNVQHSANVSERSTGLLATLGVIFTLAFAFIFYELIVVGISNIGEIGLGMCLLAALFDSVPLKPMNGSDIYGWSKIVSILLIMITLSLNIYWLFLL
jgi:hypothetical protein